MSKRNLILPFLCAMFVVASAFISEASADPLLVKLARVLSHQHKYAEAISSYDEYLSGHPGDYGVQLEAGDVLFWNKQYDSALGRYKSALASPRFRAAAMEKSGEIFMIQGKFALASEMYDAALKRAPSNTRLRIKLAQVLSYDKKFDEALSEYDRVLNDDPANLDALEQKAQVLSWKNDFAASIAAYDERLSIAFDEDIARQRARVLGWWKKYGRAEKAYAEAFENSNYEPIRLEGMAKSAYWDKRVKTSLRRYKLLLEREPLNAEARFDLAQTEAYQRMWKDARQDFGVALEQHNGNFRARDSIDRLDAVLRLSFEPQVRYFRATSPTRDVDINKLSVGGDLRLPIRENFELTGGYTYDYFYYSGTAPVARSQAKLRLAAWYPPNIWLDASYLPTIYEGTRRMSQLFDGSLNVRPVDLVVVTAFARRDDLYNSRPVFIGRLRTTDIGGKVQADINRRLSISGAYQYSLINDGNRRSGLVIDSLLIVLYEPKRLTFDLAWDYYDYRKGVPQYFSPHNFWDVGATIHWRHYLNENGLYYGARDFYYGIKYKFQVDKDRNVFNGGALEIYKDIGYKFCIGAEANGIYSHVYNDVGGKLSLAKRF